MARPPEDLEFAEYQRTGDAAALARVFDAAAPRLLLVAMHLARDTAAAEDLVQATFLAAMRYPERYDASRPLLPWLAGILARQAAFAWRASRRRADPERMASVGNALDPAEAAQAREVVTEVARAVEALPPIYRDVLLLRLVHGLQSRQIAQALGRSPDTVRSQIRRGLELLREALPRSLAVSVVSAALSISFVGRGLAAVRESVLMQTTTLNGAASAVVGGAAASALLGLFSGGVLVQKFVLSLLGVACVIVLWFVAWRMPADVPSARNAADGNLAPLQVEVGAEAESRLDDARSRIAVASLPSSPTTQRGDGAGDLLVHVVWSDGTPAAGIQMYLASGPVWLERPFARVASDAEGHAHVNALPVGKVQLTSDRGGTKELQIAAGQQQQARFEVPAGVDVEGLVRDADGRPVPDAGIWLTGWASPWKGGSIVARADHVGRFRLRSVPPQQSLGALSPGRAPSELVDLELLDAKSPPVHVELVIGAAGGALAGRVVDAAGVGVAQAMVAVGSPKDRVQSRMSGGAIERWSPRTALTDADGRFFVASLKSARHPVEVCAIGHPFWHGECEIVASTTSTLNVQLLDGVTVHGTVRDEEGKALAGAVVRAFPVAIASDFLQFGQFDYDSTFGYASAVADEAGTYRLEQVAPGTTHLYARSGARRAEEIQPWATLVLDALPGTTHEWSPRLDPGPTIVGVVRFRDGVAMAGVFVNALEPGSGKRQAITTDKQGRFRFVRMENKPYDLAVQFRSAPKGAPALDRRNVWPDQGDIELIADFDTSNVPAKSSVRGQVQDAAHRIKQPLALKLLHVGGRYSNFKLEGNSFTFANVEGGRRYQVLVMSGEDPVLASEWFELQPGEQKDLGMLVTEPGGTLRLQIDRVPGTEGIAPIINLQLGGARRNVVSGARSELLIDNLSAGKWQLSAHAEGMATIRSECTVVASEQTQAKITLRAAATREIVVEYAPTQRLTRIRVRDGNGADYFDLRIIVTTQPRPYSIKLQLPLGHFTLSAETESGASGRIEFDMTSLSEVQPAVRLLVQ